MFKPIRENTKILSNTFYGHAQIRDFRSKEQKFQH